MRSYKEQTSEMSIFFTSRWPHTCVISVLSLRSSRRSCLHTSFVPFLGGTNKGCIVISWNWVWESWRQERARGCRPSTSNQPNVHVFGLWEKTRGGTAMRPGGDETKPILLLSEHIEDRTLKSCSKSPEIFCRQVYLRIFTLHIRFLSLQMKTSCRGHSSLPTSPSLSLGQMFISRDNVLQSLGTGARAPLLLVLCSNAFTQRNQDCWRRRRKKGGANGCLLARCSTSPSALFHLLLMS